MRSLKTQSNKATVTDSPKRTSSREVLEGLAANELIFAVVGPVGSGTSDIARKLKEMLLNREYEASILKARTVIEKEADGLRQQLSKGANKLQWTQALQDAGDELRRTHDDNAAVARGLAQLIRDTRAKKQGMSPEKGEAIVPDGTKRAYILDSIRHPDEIELLRRVYQEAFCLIGVFCEEKERKRRLQDEKYSKAGKDDIIKFMQRDENAPETYGQKVSEAFHLSDYFVDNTVTRFLENENKEENPKWNLAEQLGRLLDILTRSEIIRPRANETGMFHAYGARMQSSCLSRQVGAALLDQHGAVVATGTNEVPRAGGGVYGGSQAPNQTGDPELQDDFRCFVHNKKCTNTIQQTLIIEELISSIDQLKACKDKTEIRKRIRSSRIGQLLEFSRSVHAEMDALLSAGRSGISTVGTRLFVTTFPCHSCARHIVTAGVEEVQYIEPYRKSLAIQHHGDAIVTEPQEWWRTEDSKAYRDDKPNVLFRAFTGVAPRLYRRAFFKDYEMKDHTGKMMSKLGHPKGQAIIDTLKLSYAEVEAHLPLLGED